MSDILGPANAPNAVQLRPTEYRTFSSTLDSWFKDCSSDTADDGTDIQAAWLNGIAAALRSVARGNGVTIADPTVKIVPEDGTDDNILIKSIQQLIQRGLPNYADDAGTANSIVVTLAPALIEYKKGLRVAVKIAVDNTGASVININGLGNKPILMSGLALAAGVMRAGNICLFSFDGTSFQLIGGAAYGQGTIRKQVFDGHGAYSFVVPAGVFFIKSRVFGAGGGGGGANSNNFAQGGAGGGMAEGIYAVTPGQTLAVIVGLGGVGGGYTGGDGVSGGTSSLGSLLSATGGIGGVGNMSSRPAGSFSIPSGGSGSGGSLRNLTGGTAGIPIGTYGAPGMQGGDGGGAPFGGDGGKGAWNQCGQSGVAPGGGGGGASADYYNGGSANPGASGADGSVEIEWIG
jgi:hypothetical protein